MKIASPVPALVLGAVLIGGCCCCDCSRSPVTDAEGFTYLDGRHVAPDAPSDWYIIRYEQPSNEPFTDSRKNFQRWLFTEIRQLKGSVTIVEDGVLKTQKRFIPGRNWRKWLRPGARNVRIKFVDADYSLAADGLAQAPAGFTSLFNGKDLSGWRGCSREEKFNDPFARREMKPDKVKELQAKADALMKEHWHVRDGVLFFDGLEGGYSLAAAKDYGNVEIYADWRLLRVYGDSGFYLRGMPQVQIWEQPRLSLRGHRVRGQPDRRLEPLPYAHRGRPRLSVAQRREGGGQHRLPKLPRPEERHPRVRPLRAPVPRRSGRVPQHLRQGTPLSACHAVSPLIVSSCPC